MIRILLSVFLGALLSSCGTFKVSEKSVFVESKYNAEKYNAYIDNSKLVAEDKQSMKELVSQLIDTDKEEIVRTDSVAVNRKYVQVNDSVKLEYFEFQPKVYTKSGLFFLGNGSSIVSVYQEMEKLAIESQSKIYVLNYRGYGKSQGRPSFTTVFDDNNAFVRFVKETDRQPDFVIGYSLGSLAASYLAADNKIDKLVLLAPLSSAEDMIAYFKKKQMTGIKSLAKPFIKITAANHLQRLSNTEKLASYQGDLTIAHAVDDNSLPYQMGKSLYDICPSQQKELITIDNGGHVAPFSQDNWSKIISKLR